MSDLVKRDDVLYALIEKGQKSKRYKLGENWELNLSEIKEAVESVPSAEPERVSMVWKPAKGRPAYEKGICNCGYVLSVLQRDFVYCPKCGAKLDWSE